VDTYFEGIAMSTCHIGSCKLGVLPRTAAIIDNFLPIREIETLKRIGTDLLEIRVDGFPQHIDNVCNFIAKVKKAAPLPLIGTIRENKRTKSDRIVLFSKVIPLVDAIDIEIDTPIAAHVIRMAAKKTIIVSEHDFSGTPDNAALSRIAKKASRLGCDIVKIAALARSREDVVRLLAFTHSCTIPIVAFSMGEYGSISRVLSMMFGSLYSYGFIKKANAPGQIHIRKLIEEVRRYYPELK
jgi:3-dehydroquinate dehydratase-1